MKDYQRQFIDFALETQVLRFGEFTLKSGRLSPYFFNSGLFNTGKSLARLGGFYAQAIVDSGIDFDMLFGPAYKGIPLASAVAIALAEQKGRDVPYAFNRKEAKDHGEGGNTVGAALAGRVLIIDDVISAGTSVRESVDIIRAAGAEAAGVAIALDRQEVGTDGSSAIGQIEAAFAMPVTSIVKLDDLMTYLGEHPEMEANRQAVADYRSRYGAA